MKVAGPLGGLASLLLFLTALPSGFLSLLIWNSIRKGGPLWFDPLDAALLLLIASWGPLWATRTVLLTRRALVAAPPESGHGWIRTLEFAALAIAVALFALGFLAAPQDFK